MSHSNQTIAPEVRELVITRVYDAPLELIWDAWTNPQNLEKWWGPKNFKILIADFDLRPGGIFHYCMKGASGKDMWGKFVFREVDRPGRLVFVNSFSDVEGNITRAPFSQFWPLEMLNTLTLTREGGKTTQILRVISINATTEEHKTFGDGFDSMRQGFGGTFDKLDEFLNQITSPNTKKPYTIKKEKHYENG